MDNQNAGYQLVKKLIKLLETSSLHELKVKLGDTSVHLVKAPKQPALVSSNLQPLFPDAQKASSPPQTENQEDSQATAISLPGNPVISPMVGTFYCSSSPDSDPFVKEGDQIKKGDILCIVEAMKMMNHIKAPASGRIGEILMQDAQPVEYGQHLMMILD